MNHFFLKICSVLCLFAFATPVFAQGMMNTTYVSSGLPADPALQQEELQGADLWQKIQRQEVVCGVLTENQFELLGEYFMGQMMGDAHAAMNARLKASLGEEGEVQMHITLGKRLSGCNPDAAYSTAYLGFMPMMGMMLVNGDGWNGAYAYRSPMMQKMYAYYGTHGWTGWVIICIWWVLILCGIVLFVRWMMNIQTGHPGHGSLEHLKIRYAKGEIDKRTFERLKKELK